MYELTRREAPLASSDAKHREKRSDYFRCEGPGLEVPTDRATAPAQGRAERPDRPDRRCWFRRDQRFWRALPDANRGEIGGGWVEIQSLPHHRSLLAHASGVADRSQSSLRWYGRHHGDCDRRARLLLGTAQLDVAAREDAETQRLLHRAIRQVSRSAGLGDEPGRSVRRLAHGRRRLRVFLWIHWRRGQPVVPDALRRDHAGRAGENARRGLPPDGGHDRQGD